MILSKRHPSEVVFGQALKGQKFKAEFLYVALSSGVADAQRIGAVGAQHFQVQVTPKFFVEHQDRKANEDEDDGTNHRMIGKKLSHTTHEATKEMIKKEVQKIVQDPFYQSSLV